MTEQNSNAAVPVPSALATGGAGVDFERHVGAACLATLLTGGMMLLMPDVELASVCFQTSRLGWNTDDLLLDGSNRAAQRRRVALQIKSNFYVRRSDEDCVETVCKAWDDFCNATLFNDECDRLGILTGQTTQKSSRGMRLLLDMARACGNSTDFFGRLGIPKYISADARECMTVIREILTDHATRNVTDDKVWRFLRILDFAVLDFDSPSSVAEGLVKSLLSGTCNGPAALALDTWNALLAFSGEAALASREVGWHELPAELRERHRSASSDERETLATLTVNTEIVCASATGKICGRASLPRGEVVNAVFDAFSANDAVVITGEAGSGKSVVANKVFRVAGAAGLGLAFRAETLAEGHLTASLHGLGMNLRHTLRLFALHPRKILWVESAERLLEKDAGQREAFSDLLRIFTQAVGWKILITCRDYSVETFRSVFLERAGVRSEVVSVPRLLDGELDVVLQQLPELTSPITTPAIRQIVRNPFYLDLAARMNWQSDVPTPANVRVFREKAWREVVCREDEAANGYPLERDRAMVEIALRRARALTPYVSADGVSANALQRLQRDSLLVPDPTDRTRLAPAHDVYEDWALLQWLQRLHNDEHLLGATFFARAETHPAMRRAFRRWLTEMLECEPSEADRRVIEILADSNVADHWKDDALVAVLQSSEAHGFLSRSGAQHLAKNVVLLRRAVHLLRVACRKVPPGVNCTTKYNTLLLLPDGLAWDLMPVVIATALPDLEPADVIWLLRFVEECVIRRGRPAQTDAAIVLIVKYLLDWMTIIKYEHQQSFKKRVLRVMLSVPRVAESELRAMLAKAFSDDEYGWEDNIFLKLIWDHDDGREVCSHFPDITLNVAERRLGFVSTPELEERKARWRTYERLEISDIFGALGQSSLDSYPASALQGPFANLLEYHQERGLELVLRLLNHACATYAESKQERIETPVQVALQLEDGSQLLQWANPRLWGMYRGIGVTTHTLESALMALEEWLLKKTERGDEDTVAVFSRLLRESNNVAITAVLASVAVAYPYYFGNAAVPLLTCPSLFRLDFNRSFHDKADFNSVAGSTLPGIPEHMFFELERRESAKREHRWRNLEHLCVQLQFTNTREKVWEILDRHRAALPPVDQQDKSATLWRLRLYVIDTRNFETTQTTEGTVWQVGELPPDLDEFRQSDVPAHKDHEYRTGLFLWGLNVFKGEDPKFSPPDLWHEKLAEVRGLPPSDDAPGMMRGSGRSHIAAVCLRDHLEELSADERDWCIDTVCTEIELQPESDSIGHSHITLLDPIVPCAFITAFLLAHDDTPMRRERLVRCVVSAALHPSHEVAQVAANGVGRFLFPTNRSLALSFVAAMLARASKLAAFEDSQRNLRWDERQNGAEFETALMNRLRVSVESGFSLDEGVLLNANYRCYPWLGTLLPLLSLFGEQLADPLSCRFYEHIATVTVASWNSERTQQRTNDSDKDRDDLRCGQIYRVHQALARFVLTGPRDSAQAVIASLVAAMHEQPKQSANFLECLILAEDKIQTGERFWLFWQAFADAFVDHTLGTRADDDFGDTAELVDALLLRVPWNADTRDWKPLHGQCGRVCSFVRQVPNCSRVIAAFSLLANRFAGEFLPSSLPLLAERIAQSPQALLSRITLMELEEALSGLVYSGAVEVRKDPKLQNATMSVLNGMVEAGSCAAFKIRDDFVTPLRS